MGPCACQVCVEVVQPQDQLIGIKLFGTPAELSPLKLLDDASETVDLTVAALDHDRHAAAARSGRAPKRDKSHD
jgi:hypothetical protein